MPNELILIVFFFILAFFNLLAFKHWKEYMFVLIALYAVIMNIFVIKQFDLFWFALTWWNALYWASFLMTDLFSEHYWKKEAQKSVLIWFFAMLLFVISTQFLILFSPNEFDFAHGAIKTLFSISPRILFASLLAYFFSQNLNVYLYTKIKKWTKWKYLFLRNNLATMLSQFVDTLIFTFIGLTSIWQIEWVISISNFWEIFVATYIIKLIIAFIDTPFIYFSYYIKRKEK